MDLQTRKLNLISYLAVIQDEKTFNHIENYVLTVSNDLHPFTADELLSRIAKSEKDFSNANYKTQDELKEISASW